MHKRLYISILLLACYMSGVAQKKYVYEDSTMVEEVVPGEAYEDEQGDSEYEVYKKPDTFLFYHALPMPADSVNVLKNTKGFEYRNYLDSILKAENEKLKNKKETELDDSPGFLANILNSGLLKIIFWILAIGFICFILYRLFLTEGAFRKAAKKAPAVVPELVEAEINANTDFERLVIQALQQQNYRLAVRYRYLQSLQLLAARGRIEMAVDKTNYEYVRSIKDAALQKDFAAITLGYEYVWYGEFNLDEQLYRRLDNNFTAFKQKI